MSNFFARSKGDMNYLFRKGSRLSPKGKKRKKRAWLTVTGLILVLIQLVLMVLFLFNIFKLDVLPMKYLIMLNVVLILILLYDFTSQFTKAHVIGKILSVLLSVIMLVGFLYAAKLVDTLEQITGTTTRTETVDVIVLSSDKANSIADAKDYTFGYNATVSDSVITKAVEQINSDNKTTIKTKEYTAWDDVINGLYSNKDIQVILMTDSMKVTIAEQYTDFNSKTKIIGTVKITTEVKVNASDKKVNEEPFIIYVSGNDGEGEISSNGRSDVNILAVVNPKTRQVLLVSTPRDYYITISDAEGHSGLDKLTHAGNPGIEYSMDALEKLYGVDIDYYVKLNFTGCVKVVDALGGITINSGVEFTNGWEAYDKSFHFTIGPNECNGEKTLAFVRERKCFGIGDLQRGLNQEAAIKAIIAKATSPAILTNYNAVLDSVTSVILTNMQPTTIGALVKGQISNSTPWNVQSYAVTGSGGGYRNGMVSGLKDMSVVLPDYDTVNTAIELISKTSNGDVYDVDEYVSEQSTEK